MLNKQRLLFGILALMAVGLLIGVWQKREGREKNVPEEAVNLLAPIEKAREVVQEVEEKAAQSLGNFESNDLSIEKFAQKNFEGTDFTVGQVLEKNSAYTRYYITYRSGELKISGIMNVPAGAPPAHSTGLSSGSKTGGFPVLFLNHGYIDPSIYTNGRGLKREQDYLVRQGYVVVHSDYRNHAQSDKDPAVDASLRFGYAEDVINGIHALRAANLAYVDEERIGMLGHSMGGGVAYLVVVAKPELVKAIVLFAPVSAEAWDNFEKYTRERKEAAERILTTYGTPETNKSFWDGVSPINYFEKVAVPILIQHGTVDDSVPIEWSQRVEKVLLAAGKNVELNIYPGEPHEFTAAWPTVMRRTMEFFDQYVKKPSRAKI